MTLVAILSLLVGMVLGQRFKVMILAPAILFTVILVVGAGIARADAPLNVGLAAAAAIACLQIGYLCGIGIRHLLLVARAGRLRAAAFADSLPIRRPAH